MFRSCWSQYGDRAWVDAVVAAERAGCPKTSLASHGFALCRLTVLRHVEDGGSRDVANQEDRLAVCWLLSCGGGPGKDVADQKDRVVLICVGCGLGGGGGGDDM